MASYLATSQDASWRPRGLVDPGEPELHEDSWLAKSRRARGESGELGAHRIWPRASSNWPDCLTTSWQAQAWSVFDELKPCRPMVRLKLACGWQPTKEEEKEKEN